MATQVIIPNCEMTTVPATDIVVGDRFRKDYGDLEELKDSIRVHGLINPITVTTSPEGLTLVAGGRRLKACLELGLEDVPVRIFANCTELTLRLVELAENIQRKDMTWQERNLLQRKIHFLQDEISKSEGQSWRMEDTAKMMGVSRQTISESINLSEKLERYASVLGPATNYKTENDARKAVRRVEESILRNELIKRAAQKEETANLTQTLLSRYMIGDCIEEMKKLDAAIFDFAEVDPPYGINLETEKAGGITNYVEIEQNEYLVFIKDVLTQVWRLLKPDTYCLLWFGIEPWLEYVYRVAIEVGFTGSRIPLIWTKPNAQSLSPNTSLANAFETAFVLKKGSPVLARPGVTNIFDTPPVASNKKVHPTQKPIELYAKIYEVFSFENAKCLCPFAGSGSSLVAAATVGRTSLGWDKVQENKEAFKSLVSETFLTGE